MLEYTSDEFLGFENNENADFNAEVEKKISLLYDFCVLQRRKNKAHDQREEVVREFLRSYGSEILVDNAVRDIVVGNCKLDEALKRKGFLN
jgi:guanylate kinase